MLQILTWTAYGFSVISFLLFVYLVLTRKKAAKGGLGEVELQSGLEQVEKTLIALAKLTDSFAKAGPMVMTLVSAIFFFLIALLGSGFGTVVESLPHK